MATHNIQLVNSNDDELMPKTVAGNVNYDNAMTGYGDGDMQSAIDAVKVNVQETADGLVPNNEFDNEDVDLVISDENHYDIVQFANGHIKTKNFDSTNLGVITQILPFLNFENSKFTGKKCAIIGDSISTYNGFMPSSYATYYPAGDVNDVNYTWWKIVCDSLGMTPVNCAWSSSRVTGEPKSTSAFPGCSDMRITDAGRSGNPDIIIFFIGCNDWANEYGIGTWDVDDAIIDDSEYSPTTVINTFREAYALMVSKAQKMYPSAKIYCCTILDDARRDEDAGYPSTNGNGVTVNTWNQSIKEIGEALGASIIDLHACGVNYANISSYVVDAGLHPNKAGMAKMAEKVISQLIAK